jgi:hypothetical protein
VEVKFASEFCETMAGSGGHLSKEFFELVKAIGESKSKQEEDRIVSNEVLTFCEV